MAQRSGNSNAVVIGTLSDDNDDDECTVLADNSVYLDHRASHKVNRQIGVRNFKYMGKSNPLHIGHVVWCMHSGHKGTVNSSQWRTP